MIGQTKLKRTFGMPRTAILVGDEHMGKSTFLHEHCIDIVDVEHNVASIRELKCLPHVAYLFIGIDTWSVACYSALLKLLEDNDDSYLWLTCKSLQSVPESIVSRCKIFYMDKYSSDEIGNCYCNSPGQTQYFSDEMLATVNKFMTIYDKVSISNLFKLEQIISNYDINTFFTVLLNRLLETQCEDRVRLMLVTCKYLNKPSNKQLIRNWLIEVRGL